MGSEALQHQIDVLATAIIAPDGSPVKVLTADRTKDLARRFGLTAKTIQIAALKQEVVPLCYLRNRRSYSTADQIRLIESSAAVIGLGGLGGSVVDILSRVGVGRLILIDGDRFEEHNLNRQMLCTLDRIGEYKAEAAAQRVAAINSAIRVDTRNTFLTEKNAASLIGACDVVLDCLDTIQARFVLEDFARSAGIPMVSAAVAGLTGHVTTIYPQDGGLQMIHGPRDAIQDGQGAENSLGCLPQAVTLIAAVESAEALKILTGRTGELLRNRLWVTDLATNMFDILSLQ